MNEITYTSEFDIEYLATIVEARIGWWAKVMIPPDAEDTSSQEVLIHQLKSEIMAWMAEHATKELDEYFAAHLDEYLGT